jgi:hypothetical protein
LEATEKNPSFLRWEPRSFFAPQLKQLPQKQAKNDIKLRRARTSKRVERENALYDEAPKRFRLTNRPQDNTRNRSEEKKKEFDDSASGVRSFYRTL